MPLPKNSALFLLKINLATFLYGSKSSKVCCIFFGKSIKALDIFLIEFSGLLLIFIKVSSNKLKHESWVTKALVDATPISGPAFVNIV